MEAIWFNPSGHSQLWPHNWLEGGGYSEGDLGLEPRVLPQPGACLCKIRCFPVTASHSHSSHSQCSLSKVLASPQSAPCLPRSDSSKPTPVVCVVIQRIPSEHQTCTWVLRIQWGTYQPVSRPSCTCIHQIKAQECF